jgi:chorismate lyase/3-hydroxybenzoate synthase
MERISTALGLAYLSSADFDGLPDSVKKCMLGAIAFGTDGDPSRAGRLPVSVNMPPLSESTLVEVWVSNQPVTFESTAGVSIAYNDDVMFGCIRVEDGGLLDAASRRCYQTLHDACRSRGYPHLLRVWNYFPHINNEEAGLERYRRFNVGRHDAARANGWTDDRRAPAACALGSRGSALIVYFLAAKKGGLPVENPRQISAYHYPLQHGPRSPLFSRAMIAHTTGGPMLFISGTASIVGHETVHAGDARMQSRQTVRNLRIIIAQAQAVCPDLDWSRNTLALKAYVRHPADQQAVRECLIEAFGESVSVIYLQADICRRDLLVEVEGVYLDRTQIAWY